MKVELEQVHEGSSGAPVVVVRCRAGTAAGITRAPRERLFVGKFYDAEIDIEGTLVFSEDVWATRERAYRMSVDDGANTLVGEVDSVDDDGLVYFRLGTDSLLMLDIYPVPQPGEWLRVKVGWTAATFFLT